MAIAMTLVPTAAPAQPCSAERLVGTWERVSLLRNALSVQPPDAPLFLKLGADGYWSMMEMPDDRPKIDKPMARQTPKELWSRFERVEGGQGTWTLKADGSVLTRTHAVNIAPGGENNAQDRLCWFEGEILALVGTGPTRSPQARFKRLPPQSRSGRTLVGTWERTAFSIDGKPAQPPAAPLVMILGEDGWFSQTALPTGRTPVGRSLDQYTVDDYVRSFASVAAERGTYTIEGDVFTRTHVADIDPTLVGWSQVSRFALSGDTLTITGETAAGARSEATFRRLPPRPTVAP